MIIKKFSGKTEAEATEAAKKELGSGVVIMNVRQVKAKGLLAAFKPKLTEVTVALEEESERSSYIRRENSLQPAPSVSQNRNTEQKAVSRETRSIEEKLENLQTLLESQLQNRQTPQISGYEQENSIPSHHPGAEDNSGEQRRQPVQEKGKEPATETEPDDEMMKFRKLIYNTMLDNEVDEKYAGKIMEEMEKIQKPNMPFDYLLASIYQRMILKFGKAEEITKASQGPRIVTFIGPTGVGKTTTIAKIASRYVVEEKKRVALLTTDTYRIAAAEQLRTYANILMVPFRVIYTEEELTDAIRDFYEYDYILVDTAGHSPQNQDQLGSMKQLLECMKQSAESSFYLVLSATTKYKDLLKIADSYSQIAEYQLIFTKLDETDALGNLLNLRLYTGAGIAYVTCGQNVPDDIEVFNPQKTVKQLLGGRRQQ